MARCRGTSASRSRVSPPLSPSPCLSAASWAIWPAGPRRVDAVVDPWAVVTLNLPVLVVVVLAYIWIGLNDTAAVLAVAIAKAPTVFVTIREGARTLDQQLNEVAVMFRLPLWRRLRRIELPQMMPYIAASARSGLSITWKIVLVVELLGRPNGVGFALNLYFQNFDVTGILAYGLAFAAIMLLVEGDRAAALGTQHQRLAPPCLRSVSRPRFSRCRAVRPGRYCGNIAFNAAPGEILAILGPSGIGKSSILRIVLGLDHDFQGSGAFAAGRIGVMFQEPRLPPWLTVAEEICGLCSREADVPAVLEEVMLPGVETKLPSALSLGMARRCRWRALWRSIPKCWCWMNRSRRSTEASGRHCVRDRASGPASGTLVLLSTHDIDQALTMATRVLLLAGSPATLAADIVVPDHADSAADQPAAPELCCRVFLSLENLKRWGPDMKTFPAWVRSATLSRCAPCPTSPPRTAFSATTRPQQPTFQAFFWHRKAAANGGQTKR